MNWKNYWEWKNWRCTEVVRVSACVVVVVVIICLCGGGCGWVLRVVELLTG